MGFNSGFKGLNDSVLNALSIPRDQNHSIVIEFN